VFSALEAGADGYFLKDGDETEMMLAIRHVLSGRRYLCPGVSEQLIDGYLLGSGHLRTQSAWDAVTPREREILKLVAEGYKSREIAAELFISLKTVEKHRSNLMKKLNLHTVADLTALAIQKGLVENRSPRRLDPES
jgi:DNA-binding NarL/FixJ family response regulator